MNRYSVYITPDALQEVKELPGHIRQRVKRAIDGLAENPRPSHARALDMPLAEISAWRLRLDKWRIVYMISDADLAVDVLAVRRRPPYDYGDLEALLSEAM